MLWLVRSAIVALYPSGVTDAQGAAVPGAADCGLDAFLVRFRKESPALIWVGVVAGALVFHLTPVLTVYLPLPAFWLPASLQDRHAARIATTRLYLLRQAIFLLKMAAGLCWGGHPAVRARLALPPLAEDPGTWRTS